VFARPSGSGLEIVCAGETDSIWNVFVSTALWESAKNLHGATVAYIHLNPDQNARAMESADLVAKHQPPMNVDLQVESAS
jgi:hypothetical protein